MILQVNMESVVIVELGIQGLYIRGVKRTVRFSDEDSSFNFTAGVFVKYEHFPLSEPVMQKLKSRLEHIMSLKIIRYSVNTTMFNCESLVYYIKTGQKYCTELTTIIRKFGKIGLCIILVVDFLAMFYNNVIYKCCTIVKLYRMLKFFVKRNFDRFLLLLLNYIVYVLRKCN